MLAGLMFAADCIGTENCGESTTPALVMLGRFGYWGWTIYDAGRAAERANARRRWLRISLIVAPVGPPFIDGNEPRGVKLGLSVASPRRTRP